MELSTTEVMCTSIQNNYSEFAPLRLCWRTWSTLLAYAQIESQPNPK